MSDTPRTDMLCRTVDNISIVGGKIHQATIETVDASFARQLERELTEALGEIKGLRRLVNDCHIVAGQLETERNEARAEIGRLKISLATESMRADGITIANDALESNISERDELIERMRRALEYALTEARSTECERLIKAALSAAGMGGKWAGNEEV